MDWGETRTGKKKEGKGWASDLFVDLKGGNAGNLASVPQFVEHRPERWLV